MRMMYPELFRKKPQDNQLGHRKNHPGQMLTKSILETKTRMKEPFLATNPGRIRRVLHRRMQKTRKRSRKRSIRKPLLSS